MFNQKKALHGSRQKNGWGGAAGGIHYLPKAYPYRWRGIVGIASRGGLMGEAKKNPRLCLWAAEDFFKFWSGMLPGKVYSSGSMITSTWLPSFRITFFTKAATFSGVRPFTIFL